MQRDPSIHLKLSDLREIISTLGYPPSLANKILLAGRNLSPLHRVTLKTRKATVKKRNSIAAANNAKIFAEMLYNHQIGNNAYAGCYLYTEKDKAWVSVCKASAVADSFVTHFKYDIDIGYSIFIEVTLKLMRKNYTITKFEYYKDKIFQYHASEIECNNDLSPKSSIKVFQWYRKYLAEYAGVPDYSISKDDKNLKIHFVRAKELADSLNANYRDWVQAQFMGLSFLTIVPEPNQLYTEKAEERYRKYKNAKKVKEKGSKIVFKDDMEKKYFEIMNK